MKLTRYSHSLLAALALMAGAATLTGCQDSYDAPDMVTPVATLTPNTTLADFKTAYASASVELVPLKDETTQTPYVLHGRVISSDASGNIYQSLVIQDETAALTISVRRASMWVDYRLGQDVVINATGLYMGSYNGLLQLGGLGEYNHAESMTFMSWDEFRAHSQLNGLPDQNFKYVRQEGPWPADDPYCIVTSIGSLPSAGEEMRNMQGQLVELQNVSFVEGGKATFAPYQESVDRYITDALGNRLNVRCSGYSNFYSTMLPTGTGSVRGILSYYQDAWQLLLRDINDVIFNAHGTKDEPYTVEEALAQDNNGRTAWTSGYIVGSVKSGVSEVTSADQIEWTANADMDNTVVIAASKDERDIGKCLVVALPSGSRMRQLVNLADNPQNLGKNLLVRGSYNKLLGMHGITDTGGALTDFELEGMSLGDYGSGTEASPYKVKFLLDNPDPVNQIWVEGYIVGFVSGKDFNSGAEFSANTAGKDYANANVIIADSKDCTSTAKAIPVRVSDRNALGLKANPSMLGKRVKFFGNAGEYLEAFGMATTERYVIVE